MIGPFINSGCIVAGGLLGAFTGRVIRPELRVRINYVFACVSLSLGVFMLSQARSMPPAILAILIGTALGELLRLDAVVMRLAFGAVGCFRRRKAAPAAGPDEDAPEGAPAGTPQAAEPVKPAPAVTPEQVFRDQFSVVTVLFCFSVLGTVGPMQEGMTGDYSLLLVKALLDLFTALIFAANIGGVVAVLALPQLAFQSAFFLAATLILPLVTPTMLADFTTCGGIIMLGTALRQFSLVEVPILSMLPSLFVVMPLSALWTHLMG
ncbi:MAG: DUF554 domain-containing protein [Desulfovibrionaceae bacterium]